MKRGGICDRIIFFLKRKEKNFESVWSDIKKFVVGFRG